MSNAKLGLLDQSRHTAPSGSSPAKSGVVLKSASFEPGGDAARDEHTRAAVEKAGYEPPPPELPPVDDARMSTPQEAHAQLDRNIQRYGAAVEEAKKEYLDWKEVVGGSDVHIGQEAQIALLETSNAPDIVYYLARHREEAAKLGKMTPVGAIAEVARLSAQLARPGSSESRPRRPSANFVENATFAEIARLPNYPGKSRDLKRCGGR